MKKNYNCHYCSFSADNPDDTLQHMFREHNRRTASVPVVNDRRRRTWTDDLVSLQEAVVK